MWSLAQALRDDGSVLVEDTEEPSDFSGIGGHGCAQGKVADGHGTIFLRDGVDKRAYAISNGIFKELGMPFGVIAGDINFYAEIAVRFYSNTAIEFLGIILKHFPVLEHGSAEPSFIVADLVEPVAGGVIITFVEGTNIGLKAGDKIPTGAGEAVAHAENTGLLHKTG